MPLPHETSPEDIVAICTHLAEKGRAPASEVLRAIGREGRKHKLAACEQLGFIENVENGGIDVTRRGRNVVQGGSNKVQSFRKAISGLSAYKHVLLRALTRKEFTLTSENVISHWKNNFSSELLAAPADRRSQAAGFFRLSEAAGLGEFIEGRKGHETRLVYDADSLREFMKESDEGRAEERVKSPEEAAAAATPSDPKGGNDREEASGSARESVRDGQIPPDGPVSTHGRRHDREVASHRAVDEVAGRRKRSDYETGMLVSLVADAEFFLTDDGAAHADILVDGHRRTMGVRGEEFNRLLKKRHYEATSRAPGAGALKTALNTLEARAAHEGRTRSIFLRVSSRGNRVYLDLGDELWQRVVIDSDGWRMAADPPVRFRRTRHMRPLPAPRPGGSIDRLRSFLNVKYDHQFVLAVCWALFVLRAEGPCPVLAISGAAGSGKTTFSNVLRALLDPSAAVPGGPPRTEQALLAAADDSLVLAFDNVSRLSDPISDALCRLATGYTTPSPATAADGDKSGLSGRTPIVINGIHDFVTREDLADRSLFMPLDLIPGDGRRTETELWRDFEEEKPFILGALLDGVARGMARLEATRPRELPRMADFARFSMACETAYWEEGTFLSAYRENETEAVQMTLDTNPVARGVCELVESSGGSWQGTAEDLRNELLGGDSPPPRTLLPSPRITSQRLADAEPHLRMLGFKVERRKEGRARRRVIHITKISASPAAWASGADRGQGRNA